MSPVDQAFAQFPRSWPKRKSVGRNMIGRSPPRLTEKIHFLLKIVTTNS